MYQHTQLGTLTIVALTIGIIFSLWFSIKTQWSAVAIGVLAILTLFLPLFYSLSVTVTPEAIRCSFGVGLISRTIAIDHIQEAYPVRNPWYFGWGIRAIPGGWMFNVSGLDAVELKLKSNGKFRIGTDDAVGLLSAIQQAKQET
jgi:hypothetical protein